MEVAGRGGAIPASHPTGELHLLRIAAAIGTTREMGGVEVGLFGLEGVKFYSPSHEQTADSTRAKSAEESDPSRRINRGRGTVTNPCASNAPGFKNGTGTCTSKLVPAKLVV